MLTQRLGEALQPCRELRMGQQHHALQGQECQLCGPLLSPVIQLGSRTDSRCQRGKHGFPGQGVQEIQGTMVWSQQVCAQVRQALCSGRIYSSLCSPSDSAQPNVVLGQALACLGAHAVPLWTSYIGAMLS